MSETFSWVPVSLRSERPQAACCHTLLNYKDRFLILFGGGSTSRISNAVHVFDLDTHLWREVKTANSEIVAPRIAHSAVIYKNKMIVYGGQDFNNHLFFDDVVVLDLDTWHWSLLQFAPPEPDGPGARNMHTAHVIHDRMYVVMGYSETVTSWLWYLDLKDNTWHDVTTAVHFDNDARLHFAPVYGHNSIVMHDSLYIYGGRFRTQGYFQTYSGGLYSLHLATNTLTMLQCGSGEHPPCRYGAALMVLNDRLYLYGGDSNTNVATLYYDDMWMIDFRTEHPRWVELPRGPKGRSGHSFATARDALYVVGGEQPSAGDAEGERFSDEVFRLPLGYAARLPLQETLSRWLSRADANTHALHSLGSGPMACLAHNLPIGVRRSLQLCGHPASSAPPSFFYDRESFGPYTQPAKGP